MNKYKSLLVIFGGLFVALIVFGITLSWYNGAIRLTNTTEAQYKDNQNVYDAMWKKIKETAQVTDAYKEGFKEVLLGAVGKRYGEDGAQGAFLWLKEQNPGLPQETFLKLQSVIEAGRNDFMNGQKVLLDKQRKLKDYLYSGTGEFFRLFFSFPREVYGEYKPSKDLDGDGLLTALDYPIVTSEQTQEAFTTGKAPEIKVF